jgi:hypothetical protein
MARLGRCTHGLGIRITYCDYWYGYSLDLFWFGCAGLCSIGIIGYRFSFDDSSISERIFLAIACRSRSSRALMRAGRRYIIAIVSLMMDLRRAMPTATAMNAGR